MERTGARYRSLFRGRVTARCGRKLSCRPASATSSWRPGSEALDAPDGSGFKAEITSTDSGGKWAITHEFKTSPAIIPPTDYAALLKVESTLGLKSGKAFLLQKD